MVVGAMHTFFTFFSTKMAEYFIRNLWESWGGHRLKIELFFKINIFI